MALTFSSYRLLLMLATIFAGIHAQERKCYYPNGAEEPNDIPCGNDTVSACCGYDSRCWSNGLCQSLDQPETSPKFIRGSCTSRDWGETQSCPHYCTTGGAQGHGSQMGQCSDDAAHFICMEDGQGDESDCGDKDKYISFDEEPSVVTTVTLATSTATDPARTSSDDDGDEVSNGISGESKSSNGKRSQGYSNGILAGSIVGAFVGGLALGILGTWVFIRKRSNRALESLSSPGITPPSPPVAPFEVTSSPRAGSEAAIGSGSALGTGSSQTQPAELGSRSLLGELTATPRNVSPSRNIHGSD